MVLLGGILHFGVHSYHSFHIQLYEHILHILYIYINIYIYIMYIYSIRYTYIYIHRYIDHICAADMIVFFSVRG